MALALYRKYRPAKFAEVVGQEHVTEPLSVALAAGRINHAYLFSGPRGCGKTSSARILARSLNCVEGPTPDPCGVCSSCVSLAPGGPGNIDVTELDAASHGGVDDTRELRDRAFFAPAESRYRVFIVDEAHMITTQGFNALLKIVEEPPEHLVFVFATTEPEKVLPTIRSRTHHYPFRLIPPGTLRKLLERICAEEGVTVAPAVYPLVIRAGGGSARDSLSVLDQLVSGAGPEGVTYERAVALLGVTDVSLIDDVVDALAAGDRAAVFETVDRLVEAGHDPRRFASDLLQRLRDVTLLQAVPEAAARGLVDAADDELARMIEQAGRIGQATLTRYSEIVHAGLTEMRGATAPRLLLELLCARMLLPAATTAEPGLLERLERLERRNAIAPGPPPPGEAGAEAAPPRFQRASARGESTAESPAPSRSDGDSEHRPPGGSPPDSRDGTGHSAQPGSGGGEPGSGRPRTVSGAPRSDAAGSGSGSEQAGPAPGGPGPERRTGAVQGASGPDPMPNAAGGSGEARPPAAGREDPDGSGPDGSRGAVSDRSGPDRSTGAVSDRPGSDRAGSDRAGSDRAGVDRVGSDRVGSDRAGVDRAGVDRAGVDRASVDRAGVDRHGADRPGSGRSGGAGANRSDRTDRSGGAAPDRPGDSRDGSAGPRDGAGQRYPAEQAREPAPPQRPAGTLDAAAVRRVWPEVLADAKERKKRTAALLVSATVRAVEGDTLVLSIGTAPLARLLSEPSNTDVIAEALHAVLGVRWRVRCEHGDGAAPPRPAATPPPPAPPAAPRRPSRPPPTRRSTAPDDGVPLPPEPAPEEAPPDDEESMIAEAAAEPMSAPAERRDPEEAAIELLTAQLGARALDQR